MKVPRRCPAQFQGWCRYPAGALSSVRSGAGALDSVKSGEGTPQVPCPGSGVVQVSHRCPAQCQEWCRYLAQCQAWCRYPAGALPSVRRGAGTPQVPCPAQCQEWCRYPAGALPSVRSGAEVGLLSLRLSASPGLSLGDFLLAPACPIEKITLWLGFPPDLGIEPGTPDPKPGSLFTRLSLHAITITRCYRCMH